MHVPHSCPAKAASMGCKEEGPWGTPGTHKPPTAHGRAPSPPPALPPGAPPVLCRGSLPSRTQSVFSVAAPGRPPSASWLVGTHAGRPYGEFRAPGGLRRVWPCSHSHLRGTPLQAPSPPNVSSVPALRVGSPVLWPSWLLPPRPGGLGHPEALDSSQPGLQTGLASPATPADPAVTSLRVGPALRLIPMHGLSPQKTCLFSAAGDLPVPYK